MKKSIIFLLIIFFQINIYAQHTISGYVHESGSGELLLGVNIYLKGTQIGTVSNNYGFYSLTLPTGEAEVVYSYVGYTVLTKKIDLQKDININVELESSLELRGIEVVAEKSERISDEVRMSVVKVPIKQVTEIPALLDRKSVV